MLLRDALIIEEDEKTDSTTSDATFCSLAFEIASNSSFPLLHPSVLHPQEILNHIVCSVRMWKFPPAALNSQSLFGLIYREVCAQQ